MGREEGYSLLSLPKQITSLVFGFAPSLSLHPPLPSPPSLSGLSFFFFFFFVIFQKNSGGLSLERDGLLPFPPPSPPNPNPSAASSEMPFASILESLYKTQLQESDQLQTVLALCDLDILQKDMQPSHQRFQSMVKKFLDQKTKSRNVEASNEKKKKNVKCLKLQRNFIDGFTMSDTARSGRTLYTGNV